MKQTEQTPQATIYCQRMSKNLTRYYALIPVHMVPLPSVQYPSVETWASKKIWTSRNTKIPNFNFAAKQPGTVHMFITALKSAQSDHSIRTKHIAVNLTLEKCPTEL